MGNNISSVYRMTKTTNGMLNYATIKYGSNVKLDGGLKDVLPDKIATRYQYTLSRIVKQYLLICTINECFGCYQNVNILNSSFTQGQVRKAPVICETSGIVLLFMIILYTKTHNDRPVWDSSLYETLKQCKPNIIGSKKNTHFRSKDCYYYFGNRSNYRAFDDYSVNTFH